MITGYLQRVKPTTFNDYLKYNAHLDGLDSFSISCLASVFKHKVKENQSSCEEDEFEHSVDLEVNDKEETSYKPG